MNSQKSKPTDHQFWIEAQQDERAVTQRWAAVASACEDAVFSQTMDGIIDSWNPGAERIFGYLADEVLGQPALLLVPADRQHEEQQILQRLDGDNPVTPFESVRRKKDGSLFEVSLTISAITGASDVPVGFVTIIRDLSDFREYQRGQERTTRLEAAISELEAFSYSVSHDLRAPLRGIDGFSRILLEDHGAALDAEGFRLLTTIRNETRRMGQLIEDLLAFSRASRQELDTAEINMTDLAASAAQNLAEAMSETAPPIKINPLPSACGDRAMVRQVFANLLDNAVKFSSRQPAAMIDVSGRTEGAWNVYCVRDNGVGFDERYAQRLFGVFQRLHRKDEFEGTGVGLALVQRIIHRHGGKVWAESKVGQGAAFYFTLR